jgi:hypothetical protein
VAAFNRGDRTGLDAAFDATGFRWYSASDGRRNRTVFDRARLLPYFAARHRRHERLTLRWFRFNSVTQRSYGNFEYRLTRRADDLAGGRPVRYAGKGAVSCETGRIIVWSMGAG